MRTHTHTFIYVTCSYKKYTLGGRVVAAARACGGGGDARGEAGAAAHKGGEHEVSPYPHPSFLSPIVQEKIQNQLFTVTSFSISILSGSMPASRTGSAWMSW